MYPGSRAHALNLCLSIANRVLCRQEDVIGDARKMDSLPDDLFECIFDKGIYNQENLCFASLTKVQARKVVFSHTIYGSGDSGQVALEFDPSLFLSVCHNSQKSFGISHAAQ